MRKTCFIVFLLMGVFLFQASLAIAGVIFSDNFNAENGGTGVLNYNSFANWTVTIGTVDLIGNGFFDFYPGNGLYVDLDGSTSDAGIMTSKTLFGPGSYIFSFDLGGSTRGDTNVVHVSFGGYTDTIIKNSSDPLTTYTAAVTVPVGGSTIVFQNDGGDNLGAILDNVTVSTVPLPSALLLMGSGLCGLICSRRKLMK